MYLQYGVSRSYTIEANYSMCNRLNKIEYNEGSVTKEELISYLNGNFFLS